MTQPREWFDGLRKRLTAGAIRGSNTIEGYSVSLGTVAAIVAGVPVQTEVSEESQEAVIGYRDALTWVMHTKDMDFFSYSETLLSNLTGAGHNQPNQGKTAQ